MSHTILSRYSALLKSRGGLHATMKRYGAMHLFDSAMREAWVSCGIRILRLLGRSPRNGYGWLEALLFPTCDHWIRYARILEALDTIKCDRTIRLLEVSSGRGGIAWFVRKPGIRICLVDRDPEAVGDTRGGNSWRVCANAVNLPFAANSFDIAISVDTIEHLPAAQRAIFIRDLKRVAKRAIIITCPLQSEDGDFRAAESDRQLRQTIEARNGYVPLWLQEHLREGHPWQRQLLHLLPEARITGTQNCDVWLHYASLYLRPFGWLIAGWRYRAMFNQRDSVPPHWRGTLVWEKPDPQLKLSAESVLAFEELQSSFLSG